MNAEPHPRQAERLDALYRYEILDTPREPAFDEITELVARLCEAPIAVINLIDRDRQWFKSEVGLGVRETPLDTSLCSHVILEDEFVEIPDTLADPRMRDNPLCTGDTRLRFYAGALLTTREGLPIGTLCVLDHVPRRLSELQRDALRIVAQRVMRELELRLAVRRHQVLHQEMDHRVKNSLQSVASFVRLHRLRLDDGPEKTALDLVERRIGAVALLHQELSNAAADEKIALDRYIEKLAQLFQASAPAGVEVVADFESVNVSSEFATAVAAIANELTTNSFKYAFPEGRGGEVHMSGVVDGDGALILTFRDDGIGPAEAGADSEGGLGRRIIEASAAQIGGTLRALDGAEGYAVELRVPPQPFAARERNAAAVAAQPRRAAASMASPAVRSPVR